MISLSRLSQRSNRSSFYAPENKTLSDEFKEAELNGQRQARWELLMQKHEEKMIKTKKEADEESFYRTDICSIQ